MTKAHFHTPFETPTHRAAGHSQAEAFFIKHAPLLGFWLQQNLDISERNEDLRHYLDSTIKEWDLIPFSEKELAALDPEKPFWQAYHAMSVIYASNVELHIKQKLLPELEHIKINYFNQEKK